MESTTELRSTLAIPPAAPHDVPQSTGRLLYTGLDDMPARSTRTPTKTPDLEAAADALLAAAAVQDEPPHPDVALVERAKAGDTAAFEVLISQYQRQIFRTANHITQNREDAEDITQDVFFKAFQKLDQFQGNSKFSTWLVRIAVNESLMRLRKRKTSKTVSMDQDVETSEGSIPRDFAEWRPNPEQNFNQAELAEILRKTIAGLPPGFRTVFTLRDIENMSTEETAEALGLSVPAVKSRLLRARLQLRERLSRYFRKPKEALQ